MMKLSRPPAPARLAENYKAWGKEYKLTPPKKINWHGCYKEIEAALFAMTDNHCSFCDVRPLRAAGATVEHFRPQKKFPLLAYAWANLFYCCSGCQKKGDRFDRKLLKPDALNYSFEYFFSVRETAEEIILRPNPERNPVEQERARLTIDFYGLNKYGRPEARKDALEDYRAKRGAGIQPLKAKCSYRFILP